MFGHKPTAPQLEPMTTAELTDYIRLALFPAQRRMSVLLASLRRSVATLEAVPMTAEQMAEGLCGACPHVELGEVVRDLRGILVNVWGWRCDDQERWAPRTY
jgi:hypothetical protein